MPGDLQGEHLFQQGAAQVGGEIGEGGGEGLGELFHFGMFAGGLGEVVHLGGEIGRAVVGEEGGAQAGKGFPKIRQGIQFAQRDAAEQGGVEIPAFGGFGGIDIARDVEVVVVGLEFGFGDEAAEVGEGEPPEDGIGDFFDVGGAEPVIFSFFDEAFGGIYDEEVAVLPLLAEEEDDGGDAGAEENVGGQADDGFDVVIFDEVFADSAFFAAAEENAVGEDDGHDAVRFEVVEVVEEEGVVGLGLGGEAEAGVARVAVFVQRVPLLRVGGI